MMTHVPEIAIIDSNTLTCIGLRNLLEELIPASVIRTFCSFEAFINDTPELYAHYFLSAQVYFKHTAFFRNHYPKAIVLTTNDAHPQLAGALTLNICQDEKTLVRNILQLHQYGHAAHPLRRTSIIEPGHELTAREIEVLTFIAKGFMNKEIANTLHISLTTVISHRKNIIEKLGIRSVSGLTIYAVMCGYIEVDAI